MSLSIMVPFVRYRKAITGVLCATLAASIVMAPGWAGATDPDRALNRLRQSLRSMRSRYTHHEFSVAAYATGETRDADQTVLNRIVRSRLIIRWDSAVRDTVVKMGENAGGTATVTVTDGKTVTIRRSNVIEHYQGKLPERNRFHPWDAMLWALGSERDIDEFLSPGGEPLMEVHIDVTTGVAEDGTPVAEVRRCESVPGQRDSPEFALKFRLGDALELIGGESGFRSTDGYRLTKRLTLRRGETSDERIECDGVIEWVDLRTDDASPADQATAGQPPIQVVRVRGERLTKRPDDRVFDLVPINGNPTIREFVSGELVSEEKRFPESDVSEAGWPPLEVWLAINDVGLGCVLVCLAFGTLRRKWQSWRTVMGMVGAASLLAGCGGGASPDTIRFEFERQLPKQLNQWSSASTRFRVRGLEGNPFDPDQLDVRLKLTRPDGSQVTQPAFYRHDINIVLDHGREVARDTGRRFWEARWTPTQPGDYRWMLVAGDGERTARAAGALTCHAADGLGFVQISDRDRRYLETSDGNFFRPLGHCLRSPLDRRWIEHEVAHEEAAARIRADKTFNYDRWFDQMQKHGANSGVIWMTPWWLGLEWSPDRPGFRGIGHYNQIHAAQLDRILKAAEQRGIRIFLYVNNHGRWSSVVDAQWSRNPYNSAVEGGMVERPLDFFESETCRRRHRNKLRYIVARWGYSTSLMGIGLCTETDWVEPYHGQRCDDAKRTIQGVAEPNYSIPKHRSVVEGWLRDMARYVKRLDIHGHLVSTQFANLSSGAELQGAQELDVTLYNCYQGAIDRPEIQAQLQTDSRGIAEGLYGWAKHFSTESERPMMVAEWGGAFRANSAARLAGDFHTGNWALAMTPCAGPTGFWWWNEVDAGKLYRQYEPLAKFLAGDDPRGRKQLSRQSAVVVSLLTGSGDEADAATRRVLAHPHLRCLTRSDDRRLYGYVYHQLMSAGQLAAKSFDDRRFPLNRDASLELPPGLSAGRYRVEFWNTFRGRIVASRQVALPDPASGPRRLSLIPIRTDLAVKMISLPSADENGYTESMPGGKN